jgi:hypothetical protein
MIYIGNFLAFTNQQNQQEKDRRHGEFTLIVEADSSEQAVALFKDQIRSTRESSNMFEGDCSIFFLQGFEFDRLPNTEAIMLNFKSIAGDPKMPYVGCSIPSKITDSCRIYDWEDNKPEIDGQHQNLFIEFK